ncbi:MAG: sigma-70 family RNA polymerase sigma factor [Pseudomonadota bacterium]
MNKKTEEVTPEGSSKALFRTMEAPGGETAIPMKGLAALYTDSISQLEASLRKQFGSGPPDPNDIAHLAFERLMARPDHDSIRNPRAFLWGAARNLMLNGLRRLQVEERYERDVEARFFSNSGYGSDPERVIGSEQIIKLVNSALLQMPERRRRAYYLRRVEALTISEIAKRLKISQAAVSKHIARASADIEKLLSANEVD